MFLIKDFDKEEPGHSLQKGFNPLNQVYVFNAFGKTQSLGQWAEEF